MGRPADPSPLPPVPPVRSAPPPSPGAGRRGASEAEDARRARRLGQAASAYLRHDAGLVGGVAVALLGATYALLGLPPSAPLLAAAACAAFLVYQADRALGQSPEDARNRPARVAWMRRHRRYVAASMAVAAFGLGAALPHVRPATLAVGAALGVAAGLHVADGLHVAAALPGPKAAGTLKPAVIAGVWAAAVVALPVVEAWPAVPPEARAELAAGGLALGVYRALALWPNVVLADWADRAGDAAAGLTTPATAWAPATLRRRAYAALAAAALVATGAATASEVPLLWGADALGLGLLARAVRRSATPAEAWPMAALDAAVAWPAVVVLLAWLLR